MFTKHCHHNYIASLNLVFINYNILKNIFMKNHKYLKKHIQFNNIKFANKILYFLNKDNIQAFLV